MPCGAPRRPLKFSIWKDFPQWTIEIVHLHPYRLTEGWKCRYTGYGDMGNMIGGGLMDKDLAKAELKRAVGASARKLAIARAIESGMSLSQIEAELDLLDATQTTQKRKTSSCLSVLLGFVFPRLRQMPAKKG